MTAQPRPGGRALANPLAVLLLFFCSALAHAATLTVTNNADSGPGSLRQAIADAADGDTIDFAPALNGQTITLTSGELVIAKNLIIQSPVASWMPIRLNSTGRVFNITAGTVVIDGVTLISGDPVAVVENGGGIYNEGTLTLSNCRIIGHSALRQGGGIYNHGKLTVSNSTIRGNSAAIEGGGIYNLGSLTVSNSTILGNTTHLLNGGGICNLASLTVSSSTFSHNSAASQGGGIFNYAEGTLTVYSSTITDNSAAQGGGIFNSNLGMLEAKNSLLVGNTAPEYPDLAGPLSPGSMNNLSELPAGKTIADILLPLDYNGGPTETHALAPGSPAIDAGDNLAAANLSTDQRGSGFPRIRGRRVDIGAVEEGGPCSTSIMVTSNADSGAGSLRQALSDICPGGTITFAPELEGDTITLTTGELVITRNVTIQGPGADKLAISGNDAGRVFYVTAGTVVINGLTVTNGRAARPDGRGFGGAIVLEQRASLAISHCIVSFNSADDSGGAIYNVGTLTVISSTFLGNSAAYGSAIRSQGGTATVTLSNCTLSGNTAIVRGTIYDWLGSVILSNCTITDNYGEVSGATIVSDAATLTVKNTLVIGNVPNDLWGTLASGSVNNLTEIPAGKTIADILLPLAHNGGPTLTHALAPGSPAIDAGDNADAAGLSSDQRGGGFPRIRGGRVDIGAFESVPASTQDDVFGARDTILARIAGIPGSAQTQEALNSINTKLAGLPPDQTLPAYISSLIEPLATKGIVNSLASQQSVSELANKLDVPVSTRADKTDVANIQRQIGSLVGPSSPLATKLDVSTRASQSSVDLVQSELDAVSQNVDARISTRASQASVDEVNTRLDPLNGNLDAKVSTRATQSSVDGVKAGLEAVAANADAKVSTRATQASVDSLAASVGGLATQSSVNTLASTVATASGVTALDTKLTQHINTYNADVDVLLRAHIEHQLAEGTRRVVLFYLPAANGGQGEYVKQIVRDAYTQSVAAGQLSGANQQNALSSLNAGDTAFGQGRYKVAYDNYMTAYRLINR